MDNITVETASIPEELNPFITAYRDTLQPQYDATVKNIEQDRKNQQVGIMNAANTRGIMHSNFTTRDKLKYDSQTYEPALISARQAYQTGLDNLRSNTASLANTIKSLQEKISDLNYQKSQLNNSSGSVSGTNMSVQEKLAALAERGNLYAVRALAGLNNQNHELTTEEEAAFDLLGLDRSGWGHRA